MRIWPGESYPLGATYDGSGTNFSLFSEVASKVELCLFDDDGNEERIALPEQTAFCWHGYVPGVGPGQRYGFRVHGPWAPDEGQRCNPHKLLLDPYARAIEGRPEVGRGALRALLRQAGGAERSRLGRVRAALGGDDAVLRLARRSPARARRGTRRWCTRCTSRG